MPALVIENSQVNGAEVETMIRVPLPKAYVRNARVGLRYRFCQKETRPQLADRP